MKITIASCGLGHVTRGIESWAHDLAHALAVRNFDVTLCKGAGRAEAPFEHVVPCWERGAERTARLLRWLPQRFFWRFGFGSPYDIEQTTFALGLIRFLRQNRSDILHVQDPDVALLVQRAASFGLIKTRTILAHGTEESIAFLKKIRYLQHLAPWHDEETRRAGASNTSWSVIPNFIDIDTFHPGSSPAIRNELGIPQNALVVLSAAAIRRFHKRIHHLISEFARLREARPELPVWLVVAGGRETDTDELVEEGRRALGDRVRFLVSFPRSRMPELYRAADIFAIASLKEMMAVVMLEAIGSGLPSVVHRHPVHEWIVGPGGCAIDMETPGELASTLARLCCDADLRNRLSIQARHQAVSEFSTGHIVNRILDYYERILPAA